MGEYHIRGKVTKKRVKPFHLSQLFAEIAVYNALIGQAHKAHTGGKQAVLIAGVNYLAVYVLCGI